VLAEQRLDNGNVTGEPGTVVNRVPLHVLLPLQQLAGLATEVDGGGDVAVLPGSEALAHQLLDIGGHCAAGGRVGARNGAGSKGAQLDRGVVAALCTAGGSWIIERIVERARNSRRPPL